jgi:hypothetical protein
VGTGSRSPRIRRETDPEGLCSIVRDRGIFADGSLYEQRGPASPKRTTRPNGHLGADAPPSAVGQTGLRGPHVSVAPRGLGGSFCPVPAGGERGSPPLKGLHLSKGMARKARGKCLKQLGLRTEDVSLPVESSADPARSSPPKPSLHNRGTPNQSRHAAPTKSSASPKRSRANGGGTHSRSLDGAQEPPRKREWETKSGHRPHSVNTETSGPGRRALSVRSVHMHNHEPAGQQGPGPVSIFTVPVPPVGLPSTSIF